MRWILLTSCLAVLGPAPRATSADPHTADDASPACAETDAPCWTRRCGAGERDACAIAKLCDVAARPRGVAPAAAAAQAVESYLAAPTLRAARETTDRELVTRAVALYAVLADPDGIPLDGVEEVVDALLAAPDEDGGWVPLPGCVLSTGSEEDRDALAPVVFAAATTARMRTLAVETRARLDGAVPVVARCACVPDQLFLVDVARRRIVAYRARELPPRSRLIVDPRDEGPPVGLEVTADARGATVSWRGASRPLPLRIDDLPAFRLLDATVSAPGREPYTIRRSVVRRPDAAVRAVPESSAWLVVLRPAAGARP
jgi:hypothetical protein